LTINLTETITKSKEKVTESKSKQSGKERTIDFSSPKHELDDVLKLD
jgi:hypothetical protein